MTARAEGDADALREDHETTAAAISSSTSCAASGAEVIEAIAEYHAALDRPRACCRTSRRPRSRRSFAGDLPEAGRAGRRADRRLARARRAAPDRGRLAAPLRLRQRLRRHDRDLRRRARRLHATPTPAPGGWDRPPPRSSASACAGSRASSAIPQDAGGLLVSGGTMANFTALLDRAAPRGAVRLDARRPPGSRARAAASSSTCPITRATSR